MPKGPFSSCRFQRLLKKAGIEQIRIHDLRHTAASMGAMLGLGLPIIGGLLGHTRAETTHRYAHLAASPLQAASETIGQQLAEAMAGGGAKIVAINDANTAPAHIKEQQS